MGAQWPRLCFHSQLNELIDVITTAGLLNDVRINIYLRFKAKRAFYCIFIDNNQYTIVSNDNNGNDVMNWEKKMF